MDGHSLYSLSPKENSAFIILILKAAWLIYCGISSPTRVTKE